MERLRRGLTFWLLLLVALALPATAQTPVKKILYQAKIKVGVTGKGAAQITVKPSGYEYFVFTHAYPAQQVTRVSLLPEGDAWEVVLCGVGELAGECTYDTDGNLLIEGPISPTMFILANVSGKTFSDALRAETVRVILNDGSLGSGVFVRLM